MFEAGKKLGPYEIVSLIGKGGMGEVYRGLDTRLERNVAIKVLPEELGQDREYRQRFEQEARVISQLQHPHVCTLFDIGTEGDALFLVMELLAGETLESRLLGGPLGHRAIPALGHQIAAALASAHASGIVHRDLKPGNIMLTGDFVKVLDFGVARILSDPDQPIDEAVTMTRAGSRIGTLPYMSPEQVNGEPVDAASDIFSLGIVLYEMASGQRPFRGDSAAGLAASILRDEPESLLFVIGMKPWNLLLRCLAKSPEERPSASEVEAKLRELDTGQSRSAPRSDSRQPAEPKSDGASVAILPFRNLSGDADQDYFCEGIVEELIDTLSSVPQLRVSSRSASFRFKDHAGDLASVAEQLSVAKLLEGSVRRAGDRVRISARLIDPATGTPHWTKRFDRTLEDIFAIQDEVATEVCAALTVAASPAPRAVVPSVEAYDEYLKGLHAFYHYSSVSFEVAVEHYERVIQLAPDYAPAHVQLAAALAEPALLGHIDGPDLTERSKRSAQKALELAPDSAEAHEINGRILSQLDFDVATAERHFERAVEIRPDFGLAWSSWALCVAYKTPERERAAELARRASRASPDDFLARGQAGVALHQAGQNEEALREFEVVEALFPGSLLQATFRVHIYTDLGRFDEAIELLQAQKGEDDEARFAMRMAISAGMAGRQDLHREAQDALLDLQSRRQAPSSLVAASYAAIGAVDTAVQWLERARDDGEIIPFWLLNHFCMKPLRSDSRYRAFVRDFGLEALAESWESSADP